MGGKPSCLDGRARPQKTPEGYYTDIEVDLLGRMIEDNDKRRRQIVVPGPAACGKSALVHTMQSMVSPRTWNEADLAKPYFSHIARIVFYLLSELETQLKAAASDRWPASLFALWRHREQAFSFVFGSVVRHTPPPPAPPPPPPSLPVTHSSPLPDAPDVWAESIKWMHATPQKIGCVERLMTVHYFEAARDLSALCTALVAEPFVCRWLARCGTASSIDPAAAAIGEVEPYVDSVVGRRIPHPNALQLMQQFPSFVDALEAEARMHAATQTPTPASPPLSPPPSPGFSVAACRHIRRLLYTHDDSRAYAHTSIVLPSMYHPSDSGEWTELQVVEVNPSLVGERKKWMYCFDDVRVLLFLCPLDYYNESSPSSYPRSMLLLEERLETWKLMIEHPVFKHAKFLVVLTRLDVFDAKYRAFGLPADSNFYYPLVSEWQRHAKRMQPTPASVACASAFDEKHSASVTTPSASSSPDADSVIQFIANQFQVIAPPATATAADSSDIKIPVVAINGLDERAAEVVMRLMMLNDAPAAGGKWMRAFPRVRPAPAPAAASAAAAPVYAQTQPVASDVKSVADSAEHDRWMAARARAFAAATDIAPNETLFGACPFFARGSTPAGIAAAAKLLRRTMAKPSGTAFADDRYDCERPAWLPVQHPVIPFVFTRAVPPPPLPIKACRTGDWSSADEFDRFLHANLYTRPEVKLDVNLWILRSPRAWSPDRAVHLQFPVPFRRAVRTMLLIWSRRRRAGSIPSDTLSSHPLSRLPRDIVLRIITYFADALAFT